MSDYRMKELPTSNRPRERMKQVGRENLSDLELLSIILKSGLKNRNVMDLSTELLKKYSYEELRDISVEQLKTIRGIGEVKALELVAAIEFGKRLFLKTSIEKKKLDSPFLIWMDAKYFFYDKKQEYFYAYYFNHKKELLSRKLIYIGTINSSITHTREIFKEAYRVSASSIICLHNHPSGDTTPSKADIDFTNHLIRTGEIQGIPVLDHLIVGEEQYYSFFEMKDSSN